MCNPEPKAIQLKADLFGTVELIEAGTQQDSAVVRRDTGRSRWWLRGVARWLAAREAAALRTAVGIGALPELRRWDKGVLERTWLEGKPMQVAKPRSRAYFRAALRLLAQLHRAGIAHNDLAKEPNWLVLPDGSPALVDFQLAWISKKRSRMFRLLAREDLRYLLKHKRTYCPQALTTRQRQILDTPAWLSRLWMASGKKVYLWVTRRVFGWEDREGAGDRNL